MYTLGIDIGSTTSKCILLKDGREILAKSLQKGGLGTKGPEQATAGIWEESCLSETDVSRTIVTGYGRKKYVGADGEMSELSCHALGGEFIFPGLRTLIDIGGQDAKIIVLNEKGHMTNFIMNDKCAAGTGRFLDVMASILQMDINDMGLCALAAENPVPISSTCTVFAESEVISQLAAGVERNNLIAGICDSVAARVGALARRAGIKSQVAMSGGVAKNSAVRESLAKNLGTEIVFSPLAQYFGALGAALFAYNQIKNNG